MRIFVKTLTIGSILAAMALGTAQAAPKLSEGTQEITLQGFADFEAKDDYFVYLDFGYGKFIKDNLEVGLNVGANASDASQNYSFGPFVEYNFANGGNVVPYVNGGMRWVYSDVSFGTGDKLVEDSGHALLLAAEAGAKYFLSETVAISTGLAYEWASEDIFDADEAVEDGNLILKFGMRFFL